MKKTITTIDNQNIMNDLGGILESLLVHNKINTEELKFLYDFIDKKSYGYECFEFKNQKDFIDKLSPQYELSLWVDSLTIDGKTALKGYLIKTFEEDKLEATYKEYKQEMKEFMESSMNDIKVPTIEEIKETIKSDPKLDKFMHTVSMLKKENKTDLIETAYWHIVPDEKKHIVLEYLEKEFPEIAKKIAKIFLDVHSELLNKK